MSTLSPEVWEKCAHCGEPITHDTQPGDRIQRWRHGSHYLGYFYCRLSFAEPASVPASLSSGDTTP